VVRDFTGDLSQWWDLILTCSPTPSFFWPAPACRPRPRRSPIPLSDRTPPGATACRPTALPPDGYRFAKTHGKQSLLIC
jgi:hypothetical protein